ncbi:peroxiredoxin [Rapidithrix thailandica]|uniref:thioredoxin-dependent peroxiredoxin n=1 Tax=Rapidithrix thailandica TaxID=413964 RepID=A0AAW9S396_9BACT
MSIALHTQAPNFQAQSTQGEEPFDLYKQAQGEAVILYFYPKDFTPVCTLEVCEFRDTFEFFKKLNIRVLGISKDDIETHRKFKEAHQLPFELLADPDGEVARLYDAYMPEIKFTKRVTYLLDTNHRIVHISNNIFENQEGILAMVKELQEKATVL